MPCFSPFPAPDCVSFYPRSFSVSIPISPLAILVTTSVVITPTQIPQQQTPTPLVIPYAINTILYSHYRCHTYTQLIYKYYIYLYHYFPITIPNSLPAQLPSTRTPYCSFLCVTHYVGPPFTTRYS